ncbi:MAG: hypothetical protein LLG14_23635 [Nocardiaceae bacterium]|nr:hypothetical protein [Nocardiaceae bacterium]
MQRGEVWTYESTTRSARVLVVSTEILNISGIHVIVDVTEVPPSFTSVGLLTVSLGDGLGYARCMALSIGEPQRFEQRVAILAPDVMDRVGMALSAVLDL